MISPESLRPSLTKPSSDGVDVKKLVQVNQLILTINFD